MGLRRQEAGANQGAALGWLTRGAAARRAPAPGAAQSVCRPQLPRVGCSKRAASSYPTLPTWRPTSQVLESVTALDVAAARAAHAAWLGGARPRLLRPGAAGGCVAVRGMRHPLLLARALRPLPTPPAAADAELASSPLGLLGPVSGPPGRAAAAAPAPGRGRPGDRSPTAWLAAMPFCCSCARAPRCCPSGARRLSFDAVSRLGGSLRRPRPARSAPSATQPPRRIAGGARGPAPPGGPAGAAGRARRDDHGAGARRASANGAPRCHVYRQEHCPSLKQQASAEQGGR